MLLTKCETKRSQVYRYDKYINDNFETYKDLRASVTDTINQWCQDSLEVAGVFFQKDWSGMIFGKGFMDEGKEIQSLLNGPYYGGTMKEATFEYLIKWTNQNFPDQIPFIKKRFEND